MITKIKIENLKSIESLEKEFNGGVYFVKGENDLGKSTILYIIDALLTGNTNKHELLQHGKEKGHVELDTENFKIKCSFTKSNPNGSIIVTDKRSGMQSTKKSALQEIFGYNSFDAEEFIRWSDSAKGRRDQIEVIKSLYPTDVIKRICEIEDSIISKKEARKPINQDIKTFESLLGELSFDENVKEPVAIDSLVSKRDLITKKNQNIDKAIEAKKTFEKNIEEEETILKNIELDLTFDVYSYEKAIEKLKNDIEAAKEKAAKTKEEILKAIEKYKSRISDAEKYLSENEKESTEIIDENIKNASVINSKFDENTKYKNYQTKLKEAEAKKNEIELGIENLANEKTILLTENNPVEGLTFDDEMLYLNGIPFTKENISDSSKLLIAFKIQSMKNPRSKIFLIARGESIGKKKMETILKFAKENGYQGFIEKFEFGQEDLRIEEYEVIS